jgi:alpha-beta hydrolase superfamily lysophospholipase
MLRSDSVLDVDDVARRALQLGPVVTVARIEDALHDVFLSRPTPRRAAFAAIDRWAGGYLR